MDLLSNKTHQSRTNLPEKVLQFGTGILLRGLPDFFIDKANKQGVFNGKIVVVKSTAGTADDFQAQDGLFTTFIRGIQNGEVISENIVNEAITRVVSANDQWSEILQVAQSNDLEVIISNTTEVGIQYVPESIFASPPASFPAKLTAILYQRYKASQNKALVIVPTELIPENGTKLKEIVLQQATFNQLEQEFTTWLADNSIFCNSLVDRIVTNATPEAKASLTYQDHLAIQTEPYCLWAIEGNKKVKETLSFCQVDSGVVIAENIDYYRERKLRLLNGTHTISVCKGFLKGLNTVFECMQDAEMQAFIKNVMLDEIMPTVLAQKYAIKVSKEEINHYAHEILDRFRNPHIVHYLINITFQATMKMKMRNLPTILRYRELFGKKPTLMMQGFEAYALFMKVAKEEDNKFFGKRNQEYYLIQDDAATYFSEKWGTKNLHNPQEVESYLEEVRADTAFWGTNLNT
jgi:tagaturonate reductase